MRTLLGGLFISGAVLYAAIASHFYQQERWARSPSHADVVSADRLRHPDAILGVARQAIESGDFSDPIEGYLLRSLREAPASYQSSSLLAAFLANRLGDPERTALAFDTALELFPANGRLHLSYAQWLLSLESGRSRWIDDGRSVETRAPVPTDVPVRHLRAAAHFEPELVPACLKLLARSGLPSSEWATIVPDTPWARSELARALADSGNREQALEVLAAAISSTSDPRFLQRAAQVALEWGAPAVTLEAGRRWLEQEHVADGGGIPFARAVLSVARAHLELGEPKLAYQLFEEALGKIELSPPAKVELLAGMAYLYSRQEQPVVARSLLLRAADLAPQDASVWLALARAYRAAGDEESAVQSYRKVLRIQPRHPEAEQELRPLVLRHPMPAGGS